VTRGIIAAVSADGVIGVGNTIPWHYPADLKRFKRLTAGATVIMGRRTWESLPRKPLPKRRNIVITRSRIDGVECFAGLADALATCSGDVWFIGGARLYEEAMQYADVIDLTYVPDRVPAQGAVCFPEIDAQRFEAGPRQPVEDDPRLENQVFRRR